MNPFTLFAIYDINYPEINRYIGMTTREPHILQWMLIREVQLKMSTPKVEWLKKTNYAIRILETNLAWSEALMKKHELIEAGDEQTKAINRLMEPKKKVKRENQFTRKKVNQFTLDGVYVQTFDTMGEAAASVGAHQSSISNSCSGRTKICKGFLWQYA
jgi:hypothetical protein